VGSFYFEQGKLKLINSRKFLGFFGEELAGRFTVDSSYIFGIKCEVGLRASPVLFDEIE
jgi:hypothetical protein